MNKIILESLFWLHMIIIIIGVLMGLVLPLPVVLIIVIIHRLQFLLFDDCLLSKYQKQLQGISQHTHFLQFAVKKIFNKNINDKQSHWLDYGLVGAALVIAIIRTIVLS